MTTGGAPWVYDTLDHRIGGFGQQQGGGQSITFTSQYGTVDLSALPLVSRDGHAVQAQPARTSPMSPSLSSSTIPEAALAKAPIDDLATHMSSKEDVIALLQRLGELMEKGYISKDEFEAKLRGLIPRPLHTDSQQGGIPSA